MLYNGRCSDIVRIDIYFKLIHSDGRASYIANAGPNVSHGGPNVSNHGFRINLYPSYSLINTELSLFIFKLVYKIHRKEPHMAKVVLTDTTTGKTLTIYYEGELENDVKFLLPEADGELVTDANLLDVLGKADDSINKPNILPATGAGNTIDNPESYVGDIQIAPYVTNTSFVGEHTGTLWEMSYNRDFSTIDDKSYLLPNEKEIWRPNVTKPSTKYYVRYRYVSDNMASPWSKTISLTSPADFIIQPRTTSIDDVRGATIINYSPLEYVGTPKTLQNTTITIYDMDGRTVDNVTLSAEKTVYNVPYGVLKSNTKYLLGLYQTDTENNKTSTHYEYFTSAHSPINKPIVNYVLTSGKHILIGSPFISEIPDDTHTSTTWKVYERDSNIVVVDSKLDTKNLTTYELPANIDLNKEYVIEAKYHNSSNCVSDLAKSYFQKKIPLADTPTFNVIENLGNHLEFVIDPYSIPGLEDKIEYIRLTAFHPETGNVRYTHMYRPGKEENWYNKPLQLPLDKTFFGYLSTVQNDLTVDARVDNKFSWMITVKTLTSQPMDSIKIRKDWSLGLTKAEIGTPTPSVSWELDNVLGGKVLNYKLNKTTLSKYTDILDAKSIVMNVVDNLTKKSVVEYEVPLNTVTNITHLKEFMKTGTAYTITAYIKTSLFKLPLNNLPLTLTNQLKTPVVSYEDDIFYITNLGWDGTKAAPNNISNIVFEVYNPINSTKKIVNKVVNITTDKTSISLSESGLPRGETLDIKLYVMSDGYLSNPAKELHIKTSMPLVQVKDRIIYADRDNGIMQTAEASLYAGDYVCDAVAGDPKAAHYSTSWWVYYADNNQLAWSSLNDTVNKTSIRLPKTPALSGTRYTYIEVQYHSAAYGSSIKYRSVIYRPDTVVQNQVEMKYDGLPNVTSVTPNGTIMYGVVDNKYKHPNMSGTGLLYLDGQLGGREYVGVWNYEPNFRRVATEATGASAHYSYRVGQRVSIKGKPWDLYECTTAHDWGAQNPETATGYWKKITIDEKLPTATELMDRLGIYWNVTDGGAANYGDRAYGDGGWIGNINENFKWIKCISPTTKRLCYITSEPTIQNLSLIDVVVREDDYNEIDRYTVRFGTRLYYVRVTTVSELQGLMEAGYNVSRPSYSPTTDIKVFVNSTVGTSDTTLGFQSGTGVSTNIKTRAGHGVCWVLTPIDEKDAPYKMALDIDTYKPTTNHITTTYNPWTDDGYYGQIPTTTMPASIVLDFRRKVTTANEYVFPYYYMCYKNGRILYFPSHLTNTWNTTSVSGNFHFDHARANKVAFPGPLGTYMPGDGTVYMAPKDSSRYGKYKVYNSTMRRYHIMACLPPGWTATSHNIQSNTTSKGYMGDFKQPFTNSEYNTLVKLGGCAGGTNHFSGYGYEECNHGGYTTGEHYDQTGITGLGATGIAVATGTYNWPCGRDIVRNYSLCYMSYAGGRFDMIRSDYMAPNGVWIDDPDRGNIRTYLWGTGFRPTVKKYI